MRRCEDVCVQELNASDQIVINYKKMQAGRRQDQIRIHDVVNQIKTV